ncbi:winged helix-turn-helix domain-containing protein [Halorutilales archaeon Cl-col2-1]
MTETPTDTDTDINQEVTSGWVEETTPFERIREVMKRTYEPQAASAIADRAETTSTTARKHLQQLYESGFVEKTSREDRDATLYRRSSESVVLEQARDILDEMDSGELVSRIHGMQEDLREYRDEYGVESPEDAVLEDVNIDDEELRDWQTTERNLGIAKAALALSEAEDSVRIQTNSPADVRT